MKLNPLSNRVVIKFVEAEEKTSGGILKNSATKWPTIEAVTQGTSAE